MGTEQQVATEDYVHLYLMKDVLFSWHSAHTLTSKNAPCCYRAGLWVGTVLEEVGWNHGSQITGDVDRW